jgi:hypothetical protein
MSPVVPILGVVEPAGRTGQPAGMFGYSAGAGTPGGILGVPYGRSVASAGQRQTGE